MGWVSGVVSVHMQAALAVFIGWWVSARARMGSYPRHGEVKARARGQMGPKRCAVERRTACDRRIVDLAALHA